MQHDIRCCTKHLNYFQVLKTIFPINLQYFKVEVAYPSCKCQNYIICFIKHCNIPSPSWRKLHICLLTHQYHPCYFTMLIIILLLILFLGNSRILHFILIRTFTMSSCKNLFSIFCEKIVWSERNQKHDWFYHWIWKWASV